MSYAFFSRSTEALKRDGQRRARLKALAAKAASRLPADGRPKELLPRRAAMRSATRIARRVAAVKSVPAAPPAAVIALNRMGFGPRPGDVDAFNALGATDAARLEAYVDQQLDPESIDDSAADARIAQSGFTTLDKTLEQLWADHVVPADMLEWDEIMRPFYETELVTFLRAIHSKRQLFELLADFWHNHFNVFADDFPIGPVWVHTDRDAIRAHALGNFRAMLEAVAQTPAMLYYLDNAVNSQEDANENYARELMELHCLGAENYYGSIPESQVPTDGEGNPLGYVEETVIAAARCLTGWTVSDRGWDPDFGNTGAFLFHEPWHDQDEKTVLGVDLPAGQGIEDGLSLLDILAQHSGTGHYVAGKLARRLLGDSPPASVVDAAAAVFTAQHAAPDQIAQVVRTILLSDEFLTTWGDKVKRPFEIAMSAFRGVEGDLPFNLTDDATHYFQWVYYQTGQPIFRWHPPNGYPDFKPAWNSTSPRVMCWRLMNLLVTIRDGEDNAYFEFLSQTPPDIRTAREIVEFWTERILGQLPAPLELDELVDFMAQGHNPDFDLPLDSDEDTQTRLRALIALVFMSPSFLWR